jgi:hypothetical protein
MKPTFDDAMTVGTVSNLTGDFHSLCGEVLTRQGIVQANSAKEGTFLRYVANGILFTRFIDQHFLTARGLSRIAAKFSKEKHGIKDPKKGKTKTLTP